MSAIFNYDFNSFKLIGTVSSKKKHSACFSHPAKQQKRRRISKPTSKVPTKQINKGTSIRSFVTAHPTQAMDNKEKEKLAREVLEDKEEDEEIFPLQGPGLSWYRQKGINAAANVARSEERMKNIVIEENNEMKGLIRGCASGSITTSFPGSSLFLRKDPGRGWSRDP